MLTIKIFCVGKIKDSHLKGLSEEYQKRISKYAKIEVVEIQDEKIPDSCSLLEGEQIKEKECTLLKEKIDKLSNAYVIAMDLKGSQYLSEEFSNKIQQIATYHTSTLVFVIGGSLGLTKEFVSYCQESICFSKMTFPHQLFRVLLLEQVFRAFKIQHNEKYHK